MKLIKIATEYYLLSNGGKILADEYICDTNTKEVYTAVVDGGLIKYCHKVLASTDTNLERTALIDKEELHDHFAHYTKQDDIEDICYKAVLSNGKWNHLPDKNNRPVPQFFWNEVDSMVNGYLLALKNNPTLKNSDKQENEWDIEIETEPCAEEDGCYLSKQNDNEKECYRGCRNLKPKINNGFIKIVKIN